MNLSVVFAVAASVSSAGCFFTLPEAESRSAKVATMSATGPKTEYVKECKSSRSWHSFWSITAASAGFLTGSGGVGTLAYKDNGVARDRIAAASIGLGLVGIIAASAAAVTAGNYAEDGCPAILEAEKKRRLEGEK